MEHPRNGQQIGPAEFPFRIAVVAVRHTQPADQDPPSLPVCVGLRSVEVEPVVVLLKCRQGVFPVQVTLQPAVAALVNILILPVLCRHALRRKGQEAGPLQFETVRTLPHVPERLLRGDAVCQRPRFQVVGTIHQHFAYVVFSSGTQHHCEAVAVFPDLRVTDVTGQVCRIVLVVQQHRLFGEVQPVLALCPNGVVFSAGSGIVVVLSVPPEHVSGIEQVHGAVLPQCRTGVYAVTVELFIAAQCRFAVLVVDKIFCGIVSPVVQPRLDIKGRILEKDVMGFSDLAQPVGVVQPTGHGSQMKHRSPRRSPVGAPFQCPTSIFQVLCSNSTHRILPPFTHSMQSLPLPVFLPYSQRSM